ncbi:MAG: aromatic ring-hydroxylating dioxygenase subunit alpha [Synechococcales cyanobacterium C42_A2020_086]|jgi:phenylpropionate dioxygenase-like ring-hydroxylating dioxygenase large terminal subunit|nr:aromatic ring-hydroxylating dioxygenase subunit alpha [Synechococcales cyanobacterium C42_A2020_086]
MLPTKQPVLRRFWYPVIPIEHLLNGPQSFTLLGQPLVLWLNADGEPVALADRCCHRSAKLSLGIVQNGCVRCPYHGWEFDGAGTCTRVPQLDPGTAIPKTYRVPAFLCTQRYGYVWVCLDENPLQPIPEIPQFADPRFRFIPEFYEPWQVGGLRAIENSFDSAHGHFVHASSWGDQSNPAPPPIDEVTETDFGFVMRHWLEVLNPDLQKKNLGIATEKTIRTNERIWYMPFARTLRIQYPNGLEHLIFTAYTPIDDQHSQVIQFCLRNDTEADAPAADIIAFDRQVTLEDRIIIEGTDYDAPLSLAEEQHMASDRPGIIMRHRLSKLLRDHGETEQRRSDRSQKRPVVRLEQPTLS